MPDYFRPEFDTDELGEWGALFDLIDTGWPAWHRDALCAEHPAISWFPPSRSHAGDAKAICGRCAVREECLSWSLGQGPELAGVWGGLTERDRAALRRQKLAA